MILLPLLGLYFLLLLRIRYLGRIAEGTDGIIDPG
jgi:hypothetical protein